MPGYDHSPRRNPRRRKKWSAKRWRFELTRAGVLLVLLLLIVLLVQGCRALAGHLFPEEEAPAGSGSGASASASEPVSPPASAPAEEPPTLSLVMVGDVLLHTPLQESGLQEDGSYDYTHFFIHTRELISEADLALVNQEVILGGAELGLSGYPTFNGAFEVGDALADAGFDVVLHATNHALDMGAEGLINCLDFWRTSHPEMAVLGIHDSQEDQDSNILFYEWEGQTIALLNYTYGTNGISLPQPYMVDLLEEDRVTEDLRRANERADFVIVAPHWGTEYTHSVSEEQEHWTQLFLEHGVDLVLGTHPHVIQPVEWVEDDAGHRMLVYYSLGNFINFTSDSGDGVRQRAVGAMAQVTLRLEGDSIVIDDYGVTPLISHMVEGRGAPTVYPLEDYTQALAEENAMSQKDPGFSLEYCRELCREVFGDLAA